MLPPHGKIDCRVCYEGTNDNVIEPALNWRMTNNPGAWGSATPEYLVLGFSKGFTQANLYEHNRFEDVAFADMRDRLTKALHTIGVLENNMSVSEKIEDPNSNIAFGSLIRCSVAMAIVTDGENCGYSCTGPVINKSFREIPHVIENCTDKYLRNLPESIKAVIMLGNSDAYLKAICSVLKRLFKDTYEVVNDVTVKAGGLLWVQVSHPSGINGHFGAWLTSDAGTGIKRKLATDGIKSINS